MRKKYNAIRTGKERKREMGKERKGELREERSG
jgi:hypothetical protein